MRVRVPAVTPADGDSVVRVYDAAGQLIATIDPVTRRRTPVEPASPPSTVAPARSPSKARRPWRHHPQTRA